MVGDDGTVRRGAAAHRLADLLIRQPVIDSPLVQRELVNQGILTKVSGNYRNRKWMAPQVVEALDEFSERAGHRAHQPASQR